MELYMVREIHHDEDDNKVWNSVHGVFTTMEKAKDTIDKLCKADDCVVVDEENLKTGSIRYYIDGDGVELFDYHTHWYSIQKIEADRLIW